MENNHSTSFIKKALEQLHMNISGIEKTRLLVHASLYWVNINKFIKNVITNNLTCLQFQATKPNDKPIPHATPGKRWETVGADIFTHNNNV